MYYAVYTKMIETHLTENDIGDVGPGKVVINELRKRASIGCSVNVS